MYYHPVRYVYISPTFNINIFIHSKWWKKLEPYSSIYLTSGSQGEGVLCGRLFFFISIGDFIVKQTGLILGIKRGSTAREADPKGPLVIFVGLGKPSSVRAGEPGQTDGRYKTHYLPAMWSIIMSRIQLPWLLSLYYNLCGRLSSISDRLYHLPIAMNLPDWAITHVFPLSVTGKA